MNEPHPYEIALRAILAAWHDVNLDASETAAEMASIAQEALSNEDRGTNQGSADKGC